MWTFVIDRAFRGESRAEIGGECVSKAESAIGFYTRRILKIDVAVLIVSGFAMFHFYAKPLFAFDSLFSFLFGLKIVLALLIAGLFYSMPSIHAKIAIQKRDIIHDKLHIFMFLCVVLIVLSAKFMMYA